MTTAFDKDESEGRTTVLFRLGLLFEERSVVAIVRVLDTKETLVLGEHLR